MSVIQFTHLDYYNFHSAMMEKKVGVFLVGTEPPKCVVHLWYYTRAWNGKYSSTWATIEQCDHSTGIEE